MSRLPRPSRRLQFSSGLQDAVMLSPLSSPIPDDVLYCASGGVAVEMKRCRGTLDTVTQELLAERERDVARLQDALRREQEKSRQLQSRCLQQAWELKRKEQQNGQLKERLTQLFDRQRDRKSSMDVLNAAPRCLGKRPPIRGTRAEERKGEQEVALRVVLERQEAELRQALTLRRDLSDLLYLLRAHMEWVLQDSSVAVGDGSDWERLIQLEEVLGDHVTGGVVQVWERLQKRFGELVSEALSSSTAGTDQEKLMTQLEADLEQSRQLVQLQQQLLQDSVNPPLPPPLADSYYLEEWERLQAKWEELEDQRRSFQKERQTFTEAAIRLGHERRQFEQQRAVQLKQQFLCHSPWARCPHSRRGDGHMTYSSCIVTTPSSLESGITPRVEQSVVQTPNTPELYSALRLPFDPRRSTGSPNGSECWEKRTEYHPSALEWSF